MPYSSDIFNNRISDFFTKTKINSFLDVGAGAGKYGKILKTIHPNIDSTAIEVDESYINAFKLKDLYNKVINNSIVDLINSKTDKFLDNTWDAIIMGDCLEHLTKSEGLDVINALSFTTNHFLLIIPLNAAQYAVDGHESERHKSHWDIPDFIHFPIQEIIREKTMLYVRLYFNCWRPAK